jgi:transketolase
MTRLSISSAASAYMQVYPDLAQELHQIMQAEFPEGWDAELPEFVPDAKGISTRVASGKVMNAIASKLPSFMGGSADLDPSTFTALTGKGDFESPQETINDPQGSEGGGWRYSGSKTDKDLSAAFSLLNPGAWRQPTSTIFRN